MFRWTRDISGTPDELAEIELEFENGLPVKLAGEARTLGALVAELNSLGGEHGIGRFSGLEDTPFGVKNHEVREAPAATIIMEAHRALANAIYTPSEHAVRGMIAREWTTSVVHGGWFGHLAESLASCLAELDRPVSGTVRLRLGKGAVTILSLSSRNGLYYTRLGEEFHEWMRKYSYAPWLDLITWPNRLRRSGGF